MLFIRRGIEYHVYIQDSLVMVMFLLTMIKDKITFLLPHSLTNKLHRETGFQSKKYFHISEEQLLNSAEPASTE